MDDFPDTDLLYRGPGGEERRLIAEAKQLHDSLFQYLSYRHVLNTPASWVARLPRLVGLSYMRYQRRYSAYYHTQQETSP